jgi:hypothetical protein
MGALDDAIREHLELKRKHGASESEVARKENEAHQVGALPSDPQSRASSEARETESAAEPERAELEPEPVEEPERAYDAPPPAADSDEPDIATLGSLEPAPPADLLDELEPDEVLPEEALEPEPPPAAEPPDSAEPASWTAEEQTNGNRRVDDVLEETPEFLEDLPEQDRLWFDQKSPKDFDFGD